MDSTEVETEEVLGHDNLLIKKSAEKRIFLWYPYKMEKLFLTASWLTEPLCKAREEYWLGRALGNVKYFKIIGYGLVSLIATLPGLVLRFVGRFFSKRWYLHARGNYSRPLIGKSLSLLSWNVCFVPAGYSITDGGVFPWQDRVHKIADRIKQENTDIVCLIEVFDIRAAKILMDDLKNFYTDFYYNIGPKAIGLSSGFFIASKTPITEPQFIRFHEDHLVGRTKNVAKGIFSFTAGVQGKSVRVLLTHLQHSEECEFPTIEEVTARENQMRLIIKQMSEAGSDVAILTGDLNFDEDEHMRSFWLDMFDRGDFPPEKTWGGDEFCAHLMRKKVSLPRTYDYTMVLKESGANITSLYIETNYDQKVFKKETLSDHLGILSTIGFHLED